MIALLIGDGPAAQCNSVGAIADSDVHSALIAVESKFSDPVRKREEVIAHNQLAKCIYFEG